MKFLTAAPIIVVLTMSTAYAQAPTPTPPSSPPARSGPGNAAINSPSAATPNAPVAGANSFTENQAKSRIESNGFSNVTNLKKDGAGVWRGTAMKAGRSQAVSLDFQGNVVTQQ